MSALSRSWNVVKSGSIDPRALTSRADLLIDLALFLFGCWLQIVAYASLQPPVAAVLFWLLGIATLRVSGVNLVFERAMFDRMFAVGWFMAGIAAIYANVLHDPLQLGSDAGSFFDLSRGEANGLLLEDIRTITEGAGAVVIWRAVYDVFAAMGFEKSRYVGILINTTAVALTGVLSVRMVRHVYGSDPARQRRLTMMFSFCGMLWLFSAIHLRDAVVMLAVTANCLVWVRYLMTPRVGAVVTLLLANALLFAVFALLRSEYAFVPIALFLAAMGSFALTLRARRRLKLVSCVAAVAFVLGTGSIYTDLSDEALFALTRGNEAYLEQTNEQAAADSLGVALIVNQPLPIRLPLGIAYLFVFPIPFWSGFQLDSAAALFKSCNVLFFYALTPLLVLSLVRIGRSEVHRARVNVFLLLLIIGFAAAIAGTSLETRHFGAFFPALFIFALLPDLQRTQDRHAYRVLLACFLAMVATVHAVWTLLRLT